MWSTWLLTISAASAAHVSLHVAPSTLATTCYGPPRNAPLINDTLSGPLMRFPIRSRVDIHLENRLSDPFALHWHGLDQRATPYSDGVPFITQFPIPAGMSRTYSMTLDKAGTYFYHAHSRLHALTAYGVLVVEDGEEQKSLGYDEDRVLVLGDHYAVDVNALTERDHEAIVSNGGQEAKDAFLGRAVPDAVHVNGLTAVLLDPEKPVSPECDPGDLVLAPGKTYRIRLINAGGKVVYRVAFPAAFGSLRLVEVDGERVASTGDITSIPIAPGQRYSVLVTAPASLKAGDTLSVGVEGMPTWRSWTRVRLSNAAQAATLGLDEQDDADDVAMEQHVEAASVSVTPVPPGSSLPPSVPPLAGSSGGPQNGAAAPPPPVSPPRPGEPIPASTIDIMSLLQPHVEAPVPAATRTLVLNIADDPATGHYHINNATYHPPSTPLLHLAYLKRYEELFSVPNVYRIERNDVVNLVVQYARSTGMCTQGQAHPWHVHGLRFYDMGSGPGRYDPAQHAAQLQSTGVTRDTILVHAQPGSDTDGCGWRVLRLVAKDNPGVWHTHCHFHDHMMLGMQAVLAVDVESLDLSKVEDPRVRDEVEQGRAVNWPSRKSDSTTAAGTWSAVQGMIWSVVVAALPYCL